MFEYLKGRSGRKEYWISIAVLLLVGSVLGYFRVPGAGGATTFLWILVWSRRLHDTGRTAWVSAIPLGLIVLATVLALAFGGRELVQAMDYARNGEGALDEPSAVMFVVVVLILLAIQFGFTIWLGLQRGDSAENRFGPPPGNLFAR